MATAAKQDDIPLPIAILAAFLVIAFALGQADIGGGDGGGGGGGGKGGQGSGWNPCPRGTPFREVVDSWRVGTKTFTLLCGNDRSGWRKIAEKHKGTGKDTLKCIGKVLTKAGEPNPKHGNHEYVISFRNSRGGVARAFVAVARKTGEIKSAYVRNGKWAECAEKG